jgi:hypothetical protein
LIRVVVGVVKNIPSADLPPGEDILRLIRARGARGENWEARRSSTIRIHGLSSWEIESRRRHIFKHGAGGVDFIPPKRAVSASRLCEIPIKNGVEQCDVIRTAVTGNAPSCTNEDISAALNPRFDDGFRLRRFAADEKIKFFLVRQKEKQRRMKSRFDLSRVTHVVLMGQRRMVYS